MAKLEKRKKTKPNVFFFNSFTYARALVNDDELADNLLLSFSYFFFLLYFKIFFLFRPPMKTSWSPKPFFLIFFSYVPLSSSFLFIFLMIFISFSTNLFCVVFFSAATGI